ncbi:unnamed protein product [Alternaria sp. RS040]
MSPTYHSYLYTIKECPPARQRPSGQELSPDIQEVHNMVSHAPLFDPEKRQVDTENAEDTSDREGRTRPKKKWRKKAELTEVSGQAYERSMDDLWELLQTGIEMGQRNVSLPDGFLDSIPDELVGAKEPLELYPYQLHAVNEFLRAVLAGKRGILLAYGMGLGKTIIVICIIITLKRYSDHFRQSWGKYRSTDFKTGEDVEGQYLIVVPRGLIAYWNHNLETRVSSKLRIIVYHSSADGLSQTPEDLGNADVVITTNETLRSDYDEEQASATSFRRSHSRPFLCRSPLLVVYWRGVFFDEAHRMDNATTGIAKAANSLRVSVWLPMTGTPLQNEYSDLRSMAQLLDIKPLCYPQFFSQHFMLPPSNKLHACLLLSGQLNAVLLLSMRAFTLRLNRHDRFDGETLHEDLDEGGSD